MYCEKCILKNKYQLRTEVYEHLKIKQQQQIEIVEM